MPSSTQKNSICVVEDDLSVNSALCDLLKRQGYEVVSFHSATDFFSWWDHNPSVRCELIISDVSMPGASGFDLCRKVRLKFLSQLLPIILMTGSDTQEKIKGLDAGADDFIAKPFQSAELLAKVRSLMRIRTQEVKIHQELQTTRDSNTTLTRFVPPSVAELLKTESTRTKLKQHREDVSVLFFDLRRFTSFAARVEPEVVLQVLSGYYMAVGQVAQKYQGTLGHLAGDGVMVFLNDPVPVEKHALKAVQMALDIKALLLEQKKAWDACEYDIDFGIGIDRGYATIGGIGYDRFWQYSVIGTVSNFASRLCHAAEFGQILVSKRFLSDLASELGENSHFRIQTTPVGNLKLKGITGEVSVFSVDSIADTQQMNLRKSA